MLRNDSSIDAEQEKEEKTFSPKITRRSVTTKLSIAGAAKDEERMNEEKGVNVEEYKDEQKSVKTSAVAAAIAERLKEDSDGLADPDSSADLETASDRRKRRKVKSKYGSMENDDDLEKMLKWKNGIGHLPGSNLKFRKSDMGALEVVTPSSDDDDLDENDTELESKAKRQRRGNRRQETKSPVSDNNTPCGSPLAMKKERFLQSEKQNRKDRKKKKFAEDELLKCETCGCHGLISEFRSSGRFCSQRCVGAYASKKRAEMIQQQMVNGERVTTKEIKKQTNIPKGMKKKKSDSLKGSTPSHSKNPHRKSKLQTINDDAAVYYKEVGYSDEEFIWERYLRITKTSSVPIQSFYKEYAEQEHFPSNSGQFKPGMKLECIDPKHQSCFCVCTVIEVQGARMRLNFDGWSPNYDFWINTNSFFLHPYGWCEQNWQKLQPPRGISHENFSWKSHLQRQNSEAAPKHLFYDSPPVGHHGFRMYMKLEAVDRKNPDLVCVSSVNNVVGDQFLIHFDEWDDQYDYWCKEDSPYLHPMGWCERNGIPLVPPTDEMVGKFVWKNYLNETTCIAAPDEIFKERKEPNFEIGRKLEVIDPRNPSLCRVATICDKDSYRVQIHFDGWDSMYDFWFDMDSVDLHPITWCEKTGHRLEPPPSINSEESPCGTPGCRGVGHIKGAKYTTHHTSFGCPYTLQNLNRTTAPVIDRLAVNEQAISKTKMEEVLPDSTTKSYYAKPKVHGKPGPKKKYEKLAVRKRKRRGSDEVSSSTNIPADGVANEYMNVEIPKKKVPSTHLPAGKTNNLSENICNSRAIPWSSDDVAGFLTKIGYEEHVSSFKDHQIDGQALLLLSQADLVRHLKLKLGPALKIYSEISKL